MFNRLSSFKSHSISEIRNLVGSHYTFCRWPDMSAHIMVLLYKNKHLYDNIENVGNLSHDWEKYLTKLQVRGRFLAPIIGEAIVIVFFKVTHNAKPVFNLTTTDFLKLFCAEMLAFLFTIILWYKKIPKWSQVIRPFDKKIAQSLYCLYITTHSHN